MKSLLTRLYDSFARLSRWHHLPDKGHFGFRKCDKCFNIRKVCPLIAGGTYCNPCGKLVFWTCFVEQVDEEFRSGRTWKDYDYARQKEIYTQILC